MKTPVLTKLQSKLSLSEKKQKKLVIKNVVHNPHKIYWPLVVKEIDYLRKILSENLPMVKAKKLNIPWNVLKEVPKEERKAARKAFLEKNGLVNNYIKEKNLIIGLNDVTKALEGHSCCAVLASEANPQVLVQHIFELTILHNIPALVLPGLKQILQECCGLESTVIAIKKDIEIGSQLSIIAQAVKEISTNYPPDHKHINSNRIKPSQNMEVTVELECKSQLSEETPKIQVTSLYHLPVITPNQRVFIPEISKLDLSTKNTEFLSFNSLESTETVGLARNEKPSAYKPLRVKRLRNNGNRKKDKIEQLKRKKK